MTGLVYNGAVQTGVLPGAGYTLTGNTGTNAGPYTATAALSDPAVNVWSDLTTAPKDIAWSIAPRTLTLADFSYNASAQTFTGSPLTLLSLAPVGILTGNDFDVTYQNNVQPGTATAVLTGKNNFTGTLNVDFQINPLLVSGITLTPAVATLTSGQTQQLTALVTPALANNQALTWSSSNTAAATVDNTGLVTAHAVGSAVITASATDGSGVTGTATITVDPVPVATVTLTPDTGTLEAGQTLTLLAEVLPAGATNKALNWTTSDANVATVSSSGLVTGVAPGNATITATAADGSGAFGTASITVNPTLISTLLLNPPTATLRATQTIALVPVILPSNATNKALLWSSSDELVATVEASGLVTALSVGQATITASAQDGSGKTAASIITVEPTPVQTVTLSPDTATLLPGQTQQLNAAILPLTATNQALLWSSSDETVATVSAAGLVTAVAPGSSTITATAQDGSGAFGTSAITVNAIPVTSIQIAPPDATLLPGDTQQLTATVLPVDATNPALLWSSNNETVATVSAAGLVTAVAPGSATITAAATDGSNVTGTATITVDTVLVTSVTLNPATAILLPTQTQQLTATVAPGNATNPGLTWTSSNEAAATVSSTGLVTAVAPGSATITATAQDGSPVFGTSAITVNAPTTVGSTKITSITAVNSIALKLAWTKAAGATGYEIWRSTSATQGFVLRKKTTALTLTESYLTAGTRYFYKVRGYDANGTLGAFSPASAGVPIGKPVISSAQGISTSRIKLVWGKTAGASGYQVLMATKSNGTYKVLKSTTALSYTVTGLKPGTTYFFKIKPYKRIYTTNYYGPVSGYRSAKTLLK